MQLERSIPGARRPVTGAAPASNGPDCPFHQHGVPSERTRRPFLSGRQRAGGIESCVTPRPSGTDHPRSSDST
jgi:hypothetical protein